MEFKELTKLAKEIKAQYDRANKKRGKKPWGLSEYTQGLVGDAADLLKLIGRARNSRDKTLPKKIRHELADCLWSVMLVAQEAGINLEKEFLINLEYLKQKLNELK